MNHLSLRACCSAAVVLGTLLGADKAYAQVDLPEIAYGQTLSARFGPNSERDAAGIPYEIYMFEGEGGHRVTASLASRTFSPVIALYRVSDGSRIAAAYNVSEATVSAILPDDDLYMLSVTSTSKVDAAYYTLSLEAEDTDVDFISADAAVKQELVAVYEALEDAVRARDATRIIATYHPEYTVKSMDGTLHTRDQVATSMQSLMSALERVEDVRLDFEHFEITNDTVVVTLVERYVLHNRRTARDLLRPNEGNVRRVCSVHRERATWTYVRDRWLILRSEQTPLPPEPCR